MVGTVSGKNINYKEFNMADWVETTTSESTTWDREDTLIGVYKQKKEGVGANEANIYVLKTKDGDVNVWGSTVLDSKFQDIEIGCEVKIEPLGGVKSPKTGREYLDFKVLYRTPEETKQDGYAKARAQRDKLAKDVVIEDIGDEPINLDSIPF
jgi:hypothetical protein